MKKMSTKNILTQRVQVSIGVFIGNFIVVPVLGFRDLKDGFFIGLIAAFLTLIIYYIYAIVKGQQVQED